MMTTSVNGTTSSMRAVLAECTYYLFFTQSLPPLDVQKKIVAEIEGHQKTIQEYERRIVEEEERIKKAVYRVWDKAE